MGEFGGEGGGFGQGENILQLELEMPERTTRDYEAPAPRAHKPTETPPTRYPRRTRPRRRNGGAERACNAPPTLTTPETRAQT